MSLGNATVSAPRDSSARDERPRVLAFEIEVEGHHPGYVRNFAQAWERHRIPADLDFVVTPRFFQRHPDVVDAVGKLASAGIRIQALSADEFRALERFPYLRYFRGWKLFCEYLQRLHATHGLLMYFDFFQLPALFSPACPQPFSAIYFRPTFHYHTWQGVTLNLQEQVRAFRKKLLLTQVLRLKKLERLYCLDEIAVNYISENFRTRASIRHIADSFAIYDHSPTRQAELRAQLGIEPDRQVFCLLGVLDKRKGVKELLQCLPLVDVDAAQEMCILLAGRVQDSQREEIESLVINGQRTLGMQIILHNQYVPDHDVQHFYDLADVILATYQKHMGSSSALIRAALAEKPVLSSDYGLMGQLVQRRRLGLAVDTTRPDRVAEGLERCVRGELGDAFDREQAARFAQENSPAQLAKDLAQMVC